MTQIGSRGHPKGTSPNPKEVSLDELAKTLDDYSETISKQVRTINFGILGLAWFFLLPRIDEHVAIALPRPMLLWITITCVLAILLEFAQYLLAERSVEEAFNRAEKSPTNSAEYNEKSFAYQAQLWCYRAKLVLTFVSAVLFVVTLGHALFDVSTGIAPAGSVHK